ncbi:MAG: divergent polysaccharide deacetylase family protein [Magnetococcales bacterium]|nr:divergent polysaccharide deacetylase family protein [Magnetococcales bacterium]
MEDSQDVQSVGKKPVSGLLFTMLGLVLVLAVVVFLGWGRLAPILDGESSPLQTNVADNKQKKDQAKEPKADVVVAKKAVPASDDDQSVSGKAVADSVAAVGESISNDGTLASDGPLNSLNKVAKKDPGRKLHGISTELNSAISSVVESGSAASTEGALNLDRSRFKPTKTPVAKSAVVAKGESKPTLNSSSANKEPELDTPEVDKSQIGSIGEKQVDVAKKSQVATHKKVDAVAAKVLDVIAPPPANGKKIVYEEHFVEDFKYPEPDPLFAPPKRTNRKRAKMRLALIIDDLGYNSWVSKSISRLPADITLAVLPGGIASHDVVEIAKKTGKELILHQPMQPRGYPGVRPGPKALLDGMGPDKIRRVLLDNLAEFTTAVGINNHMGSFLTTKKEAMDVVMEVLAEEKLFFVDSRTSTRTVAESRALAHGVPTVRRDVFIDNNQDKASILKQLYLLESLAHNGPVVGIGHPYPGTLAALEEWIPTLEAKGIVLARVSQLLIPESARALYPKPATAEPEKYVAEQKN